VSDRSIQARLLPTPFVASFIGRARDGDRHDPDPARRASAWARWAVDALEEFRGLSDRSYYGMVLPGRFHDPRGTGPQVRPHLEIPRRVLDVADPEFPDRLAQAGNGLEFPWWLVPEVTAVRRSIFNTPHGAIAELVDAVNAHRTALTATLTQLSGSCAAAWSHIEGMIVTDPAAVLPYAVGEFTTVEITEFFPPAANLNLEVRYDQQLRETSAQWAARRLGVWQLTGDGSDGPFSLGVVTPRLTANSLFRDPLFNPTAEAPAAALVRALLLRRVLRDFLAAEIPDALEPDPAPPGPGGPYLRAVVARPGAKLPEASVDAAVHFLQTYPDAEQAWAAMQRWAGDGYLLTVSAEGFAAAHRNALRYLRRAEPPERDDINVVLPLAWDEKSRVVRVSFTRPAAERADTEPG
jgi:hypothetical protein